MGRDAEEKQEEQRDNVEKIKRLSKSAGGKIFLIILFLLCGFFARGKLESMYEEGQQENRQQDTQESGSETGRVGRDLDYAENVSEDNKILQAFREAYPNVEVLVACEDDLTDDGCKDLVVLYHPEDRKSKVDLVVAIDSGDGEDYWFTDPIPAPVENQKIQFKNIDRKGEMEFVLQGQKGSKVGYGIFRIVDGVPVNLFGEGMEDC